MIHCRPRFPLVGDRTLYPDEAKSKTQNLPKKGKPRPDWGLSTPPVGRSRTLQKSPERRPYSRLPPRRFSGSSFDENMLLTTLATCLRSRREITVMPARLDYADLAHAINVVRSSSAIA
jgi:hypothetical protein